MKKVRKNYNDIPQHLNSCNDKINSALREKGSHKFSSSDYGHNDVKEKLTLIYNNCCAFCETDTTAGAPLQVEHFRPKAKVKEDDKHDGYYWLGYEWSNLLLACSSCNRAKSTHFPLANGGTRVYSPPLINLNLEKERCLADSKELYNEQPLIINPEEESYNPFDHFFLGPKGKIFGKSKRGEKSIEILKLYRRPLVIARKKVIDSHLHEFMKHFDRYEHKRINETTLRYAIRVEIERIIDRVVCNDQYSVLGKSILRNFDYFFVRRFQSKFGDLLKEIYRDTTYGNF